MRKDILSVLQKNHRMNLFSALNRERLADELVAVVASRGNEHVKSSTPSDGVVVKREAFERNHKVGNNLKVSDNDRNRILSKTDQHMKIQQENSENLQNQNNEKKSSRNNVRKSNKKVISKRPRKLDRKNIKNKEMENKDRVDKVDRPPSIKKNIINKNKKNIPQGVKNKQQAVDPKMAKIHKELQGHTDKKDTKKSEAVAVRVPRTGKKIKKESVKVNKKKKINKTNQALIKKSNKRKMPGDPLKK